MYLSRIPLDVSKRKTQIALAAPSKFHGAVEAAFSEKQDRNLWRIDTLKGVTYLLILSSDIPDLDYIAEQFGQRGNPGETKSYENLLNRIRKGTVWHFRLVANPTHSVKKESGRGKVTAHTVERYQLEWLQRQSEKKGFQILPDSTNVVESVWKIFKKKDADKKVRLLEVAYEGWLEVVDVEIFKKTLVAGIGREKAYGMGLLTIAGERV